VTPRVKCMSQCSSCVCVYSAIIRPQLWLVMRCVLCTRFIVVTNNIAEKWVSLFNGDMHFERLKSFLSLLNNKTHYDCFAVKKNSTDFPGTSVMTHSAVRCPNAGDHHMNLHASNLGALVFNMPSCVWKRCA